MILAGVLLASLPSVALGAPAFRRLPQRLALALPADASGEVSMAIDPVARRGYVAYTLGAGTLLRMFDLDTLAVIRERRLEQSILAGHMRMHVPTGRLFAPFEAADAGTGFINFGGVVVIDGKTLDTKQVWKPSLGVPPAGMTARPAIWGTVLYESEQGEPKLLFLYQDTLAMAAFARLVANPVFVAQWNAETGSHEWAYRVQACRGEMNGAGWGFFRDAGAVVIGCVTTDGTGLSMRLPLGENGPTGEQTFPGPPLTNHVLADPAGGRLGFVVEREFKESVFLFDSARAAYVGAIGTTKFRPAGVTYAVDESTGRLVGVTSDKGIVLADMRRTPAQQALVYPEYSKPGGGTIGVEPATPGHPRRYFIRQSNDPYFQIFEDNVPVSEDAPLSDLDRFTINAKEVPGVTDSSFEARAHGYGVRALITGGLEGFAVGDGRRQIRRAGSPCTLYDRELVAGLVSDISLSKDSASAAAAAGDADPGSKTDLKQPVSRCWSHPDPFDTGIGFLGDDWPEPEDYDEGGLIDGNTGRDWPFPRIECSGTESKASPDDSTFTGYTAWTTCAGEKGTAAAFSQARGEDTAFQFGIGTESAVRVAEAVSKATLERKPGGGVAAISESWARGIEIVGVGRIELVHTVAESHAAGRKGTAAGLFEREICGVELPGYSQKACEDPEQAVTALNQALGARGRAFLRRPDQDLLRGSPGGYLASVQKDRFEELSDRALNNDLSTQVSGLELLLINDNIEFGRARQVFQFAGVDAQTTYGIFKLPSDIAPPGPILPPPPPLPPLPPTTKEVFDPPPPPPPAPKPIVETVVQKVKTGLALAFRDPVEAVLAGVTWLAIGMPLFLARRRRTLGRALVRKGSG